MHVQYVHNCPVVIVIRSQVQSTDVDVLRVLGCESAVATGALRRSVCGKELARSCSVAWSMAMSAVVCLPERLRRVFVGSAASVCRFCSAPGGYCGRRSSWYTTAASSGPAALASGRP